MVYRLLFFGRCGEQDAQDAVGRLLDEVLADGDPLLGEVCGPVMPVDEIAAYRLATRTPEGSWSMLERLWSAVAWDEHSGFDLSREIPT